MCFVPIVLVVDDDADMRASMADVLTDAGYEVEHAENGQRALDRLGVLPAPCLVFLDVQMPVMTGVELLQALGPRLETLAVVVVSGQCRQAAGLGARTCVQKPVTAASVLDLADRFCDR